MSVPVLRGIIFDVEESMKRSREVVMEEEDSSTPGNAISQKGTSRKVNGVNKDSSMEEEMYHVIVVGAGPAGLMLA
jgi:NADPH-dependent 2,4-dienoyl-CoA reductase/sulfur reductase-like enzyme